MIVVLSLALLALFVIAVCTTSYGVWLSCAVGLLWIAAGGICAYGAWRKARRP